MGRGRPLLRQLKSRQAVSAVRNYPDDTCACGGDIAINDSPYRRHQVFDIPSQAFSVVEHQLHQGQCCQCSKTVKATLPDNVNQGQMGNNLLAYVAMQSGQFHQSISKIQQQLLSLKHKAASVRC